MYSMFTITKLVGHTSQSKYIKTVTAIHLRLLRNLRDKITSIYPIWDPGSPQMLIHYPNQNDPLTYKCLSYGEG